MNPAVAQILSDSLGIPVENVQPSLSMANTPVWDSVMHLNICLSLEQEFKTELSPEEMMIMTSAASIEETLARKGSL